MTPAAELLLGLADRYERGDIDGSMRDVIAALEDRYGFDDTLLAFGCIKQVTSIRLDEWQFAPGRTLPEVIAALRSAAEIAEGVE